MPDQFTLAVIGHVNHGKTALVRALTGIDTDRLEEEKRRGMSIVLGFSHLELARGRVIDFIDAPGHEDFVRTMISGATGVDGALLVVAANEGVMPQTREHLAIAQLLSLDRGLIVINKADLVSKERLDVVTEEVRAVVADTFLRHAAIVCTSATEEKGVEALRTALDTLEPKTRSKALPGQFFLPIDRSFTMRGFGLVVTGTLRGGTLSANTSVEILPEHRSATVRGLQVHNTSVDEATPGQRVAVNLRNVKADFLRRGHALVPPGLFETSRRLDVELQLLANEPEPLRNGAVVRFLIGTSEAVARIRLLDREHIEAGTARLVQLRLDRDIVTPRGERFIIRSYSPARTIGGGRVLDANPGRHKRFDQSITTRLEATAYGSAADIIRKHLVGAAARGMHIDELRKALDVDDGTLVAALDAADIIAIVGKQKYCDSSTYASLKEAILREVESYHRANPRHHGVAAASVQRQLSADADIFEHAIDSLISEGRLARSRNLVSLPSFDPLAGLTERERTLAEQLEHTFLEAGLTSPDLDRIVGADKVKRELFRLLTESGQLVKLRTHDRDRNFVLHRNTLESIVERLRDRFSDSRGFAVSDARDALGSTRKYVVALMEHLDATGCTLRIGDLRRIRPQGGD
jgi:selenocysteine-specific elongation factor